MSLAASLLGGAEELLRAACGPFSDVAEDVFCPLVLEIFYLGITTGTTPSTYDPASPVSRLQMAAFLSRSVDGVLRRSGRRAALGQFWTPQNEAVLGVTTVGDNPLHPVADGADIWVPSANSGSVSRVRASDGRLLATLTGNGLDSPTQAAFDGERVLVTNIVGGTVSLWKAADLSALGNVSTGIGSQPVGACSDGVNFWIAFRGNQLGRF